MSSPILTCCAFSFGYGPAAKLVLVAKRVRALGLRPVFLGNGIAHELAARDDVFDDVIRAAPTDPRTSDIIRESRGLLSMMDRDFAEVALAIGQPVYMADSLFWMRATLPSSFHRARRLWVQRFPLSHGNDPPLPANATAVGPIVRPMLPRPLAERTRLVINLGGCESPVASTADDISYLDFVVRGIITSKLLSEFGGEAMLLAGDRVVARLQHRYAGNGLTFASVSHDSALALLLEARLVLTAPGLTTSLECFQLRVPTLFLPPQNYSQWRILERWRELTLAPAAMHWSDFLASGPFPEQLPEAERSPFVRQVIQRMASRMDIANAFSQSLLDGAAGDQTALADRQLAYFESLGDNGVEQISRDLVELT